MNILNFNENKLKDECKTMGTKNLVFLINLHHPYIRLEKTDFAKFEEEGSLIFRHISDLCIPLLNLISKFEKERLNVKFALVFSAPLCALLADEEVKKNYNKYLDALIDFAKKEIRRVKGNSALEKIAAANLDSALEKKHSFNEIYHCDLLGAFANFEQRGFVEILATCGTYVFMPHFSEMREVLNAQVESGLYSMREYFGKTPDGFFLPEMGYAPGIEEVLKNYGVGYTVLPSQSFLFSEILPEKGIFMPARCANSLGIFAAEEFKLEFPSVYKDRSKDLAWELSQKELSPFVKGARKATGFSYKNRDDGIYNSKAALSCAKQDAKNFFEEKKSLLSKAREILGSDCDLSLGIYFDQFVFTRKWAEAFDFLETLVHTSLSSDVNVTGFSDLLEGKFGLQKIAPYPAAYSGSPYGENLISSENSWMLRYIRKASERIVDLVSRFPNDSGLKARLLNLGAKELMLAQDCSLVKMVGSHSYADFASEYFRRGVVSFSNVFDSLGSNTVSTEWFCELEKRHKIFPWMNYRIFAKKR